jgi:hypothetical protein
LDIFFRISQFSAQHWKWKNVSQLNIQNSFNKVSLKKALISYPSGISKKHVFQRTFFDFRIFHRILNFIFYFYREFDFRQAKIGNSEEYGLIQNKITGDLEALIPFLTELSSSKLITEAKKWGFRIKKFLFNYNFRIKRIKSNRSKSASRVTLDSFLEVVNIVLEKWIQLSGISLIGSYIIAVIIMKLLNVYCILLNTILGLNWVSFSNLGQQNTRLFYWVFVGYFTSLRSIFFLVIAYFSKYSGIHGSINFYCFIYVVVFSIFAGLFLNRQCIFYCFFLVNIIFFILRPL